MSRTLVAAVCLALTFPAMAAAAERNMSYDFVEFGYADLDVDMGADDELSFSGLHLDAGYELSDFLFFSAGYRELSGNPNLSMRSRAFGLGIAVGMGDTIDLHASARYLRIDLTHALYQDEGLEAELGLRAAVGRRTELFANAGYVDILDDSDTRLEGGARYWLSDGFSVSLGYEDSSLTGSGFTLAGRFNY